MIKERYIELCVFISWMSYFFLLFFCLPGSPKNILIWSGIMLFGTLFLASSVYLCYIIETKKTKETKNF